MKKTFTLIPFFLYLVCSNAFAVTEQINSLENVSIGDYGRSLPIPNEDVKFSSKDLKVGDKSEYIKILQGKYNLEPTGVYDVTLESIIKDKQEKAGLTPSGVLDENTWLKVYGVSDAKFSYLKEQSLNSWNRIAQKDTDNNSNKIIVVNVPAMKLYVYSKNNGKYEQIMESKVIVGRKSTQTPLEDFKIVSLKYNPTWTPTSNMLKRNVYKGGKVNVSWLKAHHLKVYDKDGNEYSYEELENLKEPRFTQELGEYNALGNLKFETTSNQDIYLHDTNERHLFTKNTRLYSSGCIRVQDYKKLASTITGKSEEAINKGIDRRETFYEKLQQKTPVYFDYSQVVFVNGSPQVFPDVYNKNPN